MSRKPRLGGDWWTGTSVTLLAPIEGTVKSNVGHETISVVMDKVDRQCIGTKAILTSALPALLSHVKDDVILRPLTYPSSQATYLTSVPCLSILTSPVVCLRSGFSYLASPYLGTSLFASRIRITSIAKCLQISPKCLHLLLLYSILEIQVRAVEARSRFLLSYPQSLVQLSHR